MAMWRGIGGMTFIAAISEPLHARVRKALQRK
jgi:hypothetical protein